MASVLNSLRKKLSRASFAGGSSAATAAAAAASAAAAEEMEPVSAAGRARKASVVREREAHSFASLPQLRDTPASKREDIFRKKLQLCSIMFDFSDSSIEAQGKELKRQTLLELVDYVNSSTGQKVFTEAVMPDVVHMIRANIVRALPKMREDFDPEEDEPALEPSWPHMQVVYEFLLRFVVSSEVKAKVAKRYLDHNFCMHLVDLFDSEDPRERDYLKTILHRVYGKFMPHRAFIRRYIGYTFYRFIFEHPQHNGVAELLEILGSIINGFALPLKPEHVTFLTRALIPLHRPAAMHMYHQQLAYCITQYVEKDPGIASTVINGLCKIWPWQSSGKQVLMLSELEELLEFLSGDVLEDCMDTLCRTLGRCVGSEHFQVAERALFLWQNDQLLSRGVLAADYAPRILPRILPALLQHAQGHWNPTVEGLAEHVLSTYQTADAGLYEECLAAVEREEEAKAEAEAASKANWAAVAASVETEEYDDVYYG